MKNTLIYSLIITLLFSSCEITNFDLQDNPNSITPAQVDPNYILNDIQIAFAKNMSRFFDSTDQIMRYESMNDTYAKTADNGSLNTEWEVAYQIRNNYLILDNYVTNNTDYTFHRGIARILNAYSMSNLVDFLGDIPYSEANDPKNMNPAQDNDKDIYDQLLNELDLAITDINNAVLIPPTDLYFGGSIGNANPTAWIKVANTLKLRMYINMGNTSMLEELITQNNLITDPSEDFEFKYSTINEPESRHPYYVDGAYTGGDFSSYIGNNFMWLLKDSKTSSDPRLRYYLYRQIGIHPQDDNSGNFLKCENNPIFDFCYVGDFYWGRDHGDDDSRPADGYKKTTYGLYPAGGAFDDNSYIRADKTTNLEGKGILPIFLSSYTNFLIAEAILSYGVSGDALPYLEQGIRHSMRKVLAFESVTSILAASQADVEAYVSFVLSEYNAATTNNEKLDIIVREYYLASYGNSIESYNGYRRTGYPSILKAPIYNKSIPFPRTYALPKDAVNRNSSINQRPITNQVFWDTNPAGFIH